MIEEVRRQFREKPGIMKGEEKPDYKSCVGISTTAALHEMLFRSYGSSSSIGCRYRYLALRLLADCLQELL